ncbi:MAG: DNA topoisomerase I [Candidatus Buchananbacteria bacterium RIFCSPHIGHO2_01_FULL_47_11b]|uniref:DNA topoisomerase 1 n=1 Tax=Candidatus Buchananbacteria bacterium RIFCSPHIGHO2_01_FULL_47_11b TaxID=1797537 RepID=A0A1G1Y6D5_9BACT|nr:MAG: DNA topoisomerase I [Candidatus Buchananbacteria bacterium RIFCSPHIGHO2_01_FULL_47_11b]
MAKNLVIVESPTKAKTISKFLSKEYQVESSFGHVRDLPKSKLGVDVDHNYVPDYVVPPRAKKVVTNLKTIAKKADLIYFATDEDREGEAISWHLAELLDTPEEKIKRIVFHEITETAIHEALKNPRGIDQHLVDAQQARRILDRLVGYELSPFLWKKVARGLSAGRVQSVAVRLLVEREREIQAFKPKEFWTIDALFSDPGDKSIEFEAKLSAIDGKPISKFTIKNERAAQEITDALKDAAYAVEAVDRKEMTKSPLPPFTTSTLQQEANRRLGFSAKQTMVLAQQLYEGVELGSGGPVGLITYMRTDSVNLASKFLSEAATYIASTFGQPYSSGPRGYRGKSKLAQEAHEAIRPTSVTNSPAHVKPYLDSRQFKLYQLIWQRAVASQMTEAKIDTTGIDISAAQTPYTFRATGSVIKFDGYLKVYPTATKENVLPPVKAHDAVELKKLDSNQHFTQPPARYSEAALVKTLEEYGIGRPSTYAPTIATIQERGYVEKVDRRLKPTDLAMVVNDLLVKHFPEIVDFEFTANLEDGFDKIAEGKKEWQKMLNDFYPSFHKQLEEKEETVSRDSVLSVREIGTDPKTHKPVFARMGRFGPFVQLGSKDDVEKPKFASLQKGQSIATITLQEALILLQLPRTLGADAEGNEITASVGRFGPYVKVGKKYVSIKNDDPYTITLERALELIAEAKDTQANKEIKTFAGSPIKVLNGRYGPYLTNGELNAKIPKDVKPESLTLQECEEIIKTTGKKPGMRRRGKK